jgi:hypothetical protein
MRNAIIFFLLVNGYGAHAADPCQRLLAEVQAFDFNQSNLEYDLNEFGHLKISTPFQLSLSEVKNIFAQRPRFNAPGQFLRERTITFRRSLNWALQRQDDSDPSEEDAVIPELMQFGMTMGEKLEAFLKQKYPEENLTFESLHLRWVSSAIKLVYDDWVSADKAHLDQGAVYLNSTITLYGEGTMFWNSNDVMRNEKFDANNLPSYLPPSGQMKSGEILVLTGLKRSNELNRPELATLHSGPGAYPGQDRLLFLFYFDSKK